MPGPSSRGPHTLSPYDEVQAALAPLPALASGDPGTVFAVADLLHPAEQQHLVAVIQVYTPALVSRTQAFERAMDMGLLWPEHFFGAGSNMSAFSAMWARLVPALVAGGVDLADLHLAVSVLSDREKRCFASVIGHHFHKLVGLAIFRARRFQPAGSRPSSPAPASVPREQPAPPAPPSDSEPEPDDCPSSDSSSESGWARQCPSPCGGEPAVEPMAFPDEFLLWAGSRDGDTACVTACLRDLEEPTWTTHTMGGHPSSRPRRTTTPTWSPFSLMLGPTSIRLLSTDAMWPLWP